MSLDPPSVAFSSACPLPDDLLEGATGQDLAQYALAWQGAWRCEHDKREALLKAWPK